MSPGPARKLPTETAEPLDIREHIGGLPAPETPLRGSVLVDVRVSMADFMDRVRWDTPVSVDLLGDLMAHGLRHIDFFPPSAGSEVELTFLVRAEDATAPVTRLHLHGLSPLADRTRPGIEGR